MRVLVACEYSGIVRDAFISSGHDAMSCDLYSQQNRLDHTTKVIFSILLVMGLI